MNNLSARGLAGRIPDEALFRWAHGPVEGPIGDLVVVPDDVFQLVFKALARKRATAVLWDVWCALVIMASNGSDAFESSMIAASLNLNRETVRRCLRVLAKLGLIVPDRPDEGWAFGTIYVRRLLPDDETTLLTAIAAGVVDIGVANTSVLDRRTGRAVDRTKATAEIAHAMTESRPVRKGVSFLPVWNAADVVITSIDRAS